MGFGAVGAIPWRAYDRYARRYGVLDEDFPRFLRLVSALDSAYLEWQARQRRTP